MDDFSHLEASCILRDGLVLHTKIGKKPSPIHTCLSIDWTLNASNWLRSVWKSFHCQLPLRRSLICSSAVVNVPRGSEIKLAKQVDDFKRSQSHRPHWTDSCLCIPLGSMPIRELGPSYSAMNIDIECTVCCYIVNVHWGFLCEVSLL